MAENVRGMHRARILAEIQIRHGTRNALAAKLRIHPSAISHALLDPLSSPHVEKLIARAISKPPYEVWPDRWTKDGRALPRSERTHIAMQRCAISSKKQKVA